VRAIQDTHRRCFSVSTVPEHSCGVGVGEVLATLARLNVLLVVGVGFPNLHGEAGLLAPVEKRHRSRRQLVTYGGDHASCLGGHAGAILHLGFTAVIAKGHCDQDG
jgi:hypothetical protein